MGGRTTRYKIESFLAAFVIVGFGLLVHLSRARQNAKSPHELADCAMCHVAVASVDGESIPVIDPSTKCRTCHVRLDEFDSPTLTFHDDQNRPCLDCHSYHSPDEVTVGNRSFHAKARASSQRALCSSCHGVDEDIRAISDGHRAAAGLFHSDYKLLAGISPSEACLLCHSEEIRPDEIAALAAGSTPTFERHGTHPTGRTVVLGQQLANSRIRKSIDPDIRLYGGRIECQSCHSLSSADRYHLIAGTDQNTLCLKCHEMN
jgi:predicted CXXCH cytochrome family protein